ncbi:sensor histidine kinase [Cellulomonas citrea]|uniref:sensor histidine kinase n=1 Tax=Cellulomonas citrea TaxID=1909423 RepID=UPI00135B3536|nr:sensor histidine kinase [Cellulomonas citrea]
MSTPVADLPGTTRPVVAQNISRGVALLLGPVAGRTWRELGYLNVVLLLAPVGFAWGVLAVTFSVSVAITAFGLYAAGWIVVGARVLGGAYRGLARTLLDTDVPTPPPHRRGRGFWGQIGAMLGDAAGWRALAFGAVSLPLSILSVTLSWLFLALGLGGLTYWFWYRFLPWQQALDGSWHRGASINNDYFVDTPGRLWAMVALGVVFLLLWPQVTHGLAHGFRLLSRLLLGPTAASLRVAHLEQTRSHAVQDADARLRRIERDLHDGTQARLVTLAMQVDDVRDRLAGGDEADRAAALLLLDETHREMKDTLVELREIARGIHPPALDNGLTLALETLVTRSAVPVTLDVDLPTEPAPELAAIAYFGVAELLTNVQRHAGATGAYVRVDTLDDTVRVRVRDDGHGGARPALPGASGGTGLQGLVERVSTVDGTVEIDSPAGGPTVVTMSLPMRAAR